MCKLMYIPERCEDVLLDLIPDCIEEKLPEEGKQTAAALTVQACRTE